MKKRLVAHDLFCGAGGTSTGLTQACQRRGIDLDLTAINHWDIAVETHSKNHPGARHLCQTIDSINPRSVCKPGKLDLLVASPECTGHSKARGGKPTSDQKRASGWCVVRWAEALGPRAILIENVEEFQEWGPLGADGKPLKSRRGETFCAWIEALKSLGYRVDYKLLNAADHGDATSRTRLFVVCRRGRAAPEWPTPTHSKDGAPGLFGTLPRWRPAREIIDWTLPGSSIFGRHRPLKPRTIARIAAGVEKFWGRAAEPFLVVLRNHMDGRSLDLPLPTVAAGGEHMGLVQPLILSGHQGGAARDVEQPIPSFTNGGCGIVQPFLMQMSQTGSNGDRLRTCEGPLPTVTTAQDIALVDPFLVTVNHADRTDRGYRRTRSLDRPMPTITGTRCLGIVEPFLVRYNRTGGPYPVDVPLGTIDTNDRYGLVQAAAGRFAVDIRFRMLKPHELAGAMGFPAWYVFAGSQEMQVRQIGNAVPVNLADGLSTSLLWPGGAA